MKYLLILWIFVLCISVAGIAMEEKKDDVLEIAEKLNKLGFVVVPKEQWEEMLMGYNYWVETGARERYLEKGDAFIAPEKDLSKYKLKDDLKKLLSVEDEAATQPYPFPKRLELGE